MPIVLCIKITIPASRRSAEQRENHNLDKAKVVISDFNRLEEIGSFDMEAVDASKLPEILRNCNLKNAHGNAGVFILDGNTSFAQDRSPLQETEAMRNRHAKMQQDYNEVFNRYFGRPPRAQDGRPSLVLGLDSDAKDDGWIPWTDPFQRRRFSPEIRERLRKLYRRQPLPKLPKRAANWQRTRAQTTREHMRCGRFDWE